MSKESSRIQTCRSKLKRWGVQRNRGTDNSSGRYLIRFRGGEEVVGGAVGAETEVASENIVEEGAGNSSDIFRKAKLIQWQWKSNRLFPPQTMKMRSFKPQRDMNFRAIWKLLSYHHVFQKRDKTWNQSLHTMIQKKYTQFCFFMFHQKKPFPLSPARIVPTLPILTSMSKTIMPKTYKPAVAPSMTTYSCTHTNNLFSSTVFILLWF